jgi:signal transduction histidine kinase
MSTSLLKDRLSSRRGRVQNEGPSNTSNGFEGTVAVDRRIVNLARLLLATSALIVVWIDPLEPTHFVGATYTALTLYVSYSAFLYSFDRGRTSFGIRYAHWIDVVWYAVLIGLSSGTNSIFFFFFLFSILSASFYLGFREGLAVTGVSFTLFLIVSYLTFRGHQSFELNRFLLRPIFLVVLGYLFSYWGGAEILLRRKLELLKEINVVSNPRFGFQHAAVSILEKLRLLYGADICLFVWKDADKGSAVINQSLHSGPEGFARQEEEVPEFLAAELLCKGHESAVVGFNISSSWRKSRSLEIDTGKLSTRSIDSATLSRLAGYLNAESYISAPLHFRGRGVGRLIVAGQSTSFDQSDLGFVLQVGQTALTLLENVRLLDRLASDAAEVERKKIARDLHDSVVQPFFGIQYKIAALKRNLSDSTIDVSSELDRLFTFVGDEIGGVRKYVHNLDSESVGQGDLYSAIRRYAAQFEENFGIHVELTFRSDITISDRLAAELIQIVHEGLSNIRKHTEALDCKVMLESKTKELKLELINQRSGDGIDFTPRSIAERSESLGGYVTVDTGKPGLTRVVVRIPL